MSEVVRKSHYLSGNYLDTICDNMCKPEKHSIYCRRRTAGKLNEYWRNRRAYIKLRMNKLTKIQNMVYDLRKELLVFTDDDACFNRKLNILKDELYARGINVYNEVCPDKYDLEDQMETNLLNCQAKLADLDSRTTPLSEMEKWLKRHLRYKAIPALQNKVDDYIKNAIWEYWPLEERKCKDVYPSIPIKEHIVETKWDYSFMMRKELYDPQMCIFIPVIPPSVVQIVKDDELSNRELKLRCEGLFTKEENAVSDIKYLNEEKEGVVVEE